MIFMITKQTINMDDSPHLITPYNAQHIGRRDEQQDYFAFSDIYNAEEYNRIGALAILADGMGGLEGGRLASRTATEVFLDIYTNCESEIPDIDERLLYAAKKANDAVVKLDGAGTTLCAIVIKDSQLHWLSVGDSRIYLYRNGTLRRLNKEHNYENVLNEKVESGEISLSEAVNDPNRAALTSYIGIDELDEIDINTDIFPLFKGDSVMMCSDGLYRTLCDEEMAYIVKNAEEDVCDFLISKALEKNIETQDNITVVLMDVD